MSGKSTSAREDQGFTLLEIIITLAVAAVLGTLMVQYLSSNLIGSAETVAGIQNNAGLICDLENMTKQYRNWIGNSPGPLSDFETMVRNDYPNATTSFQSFRGDDAPNSILRVTVANEGRQLVVYFTR